MSDVFHVYIPENLDHPHAVGLAFIVFVSNTTASDVDKQRNAVEKSE